MAETPRCSVLGCPSQVDRTWSTGDVDAEEQQWGVCLIHYERMRIGEPWATHTNLPESAEQRIVLRRDLAVRTSETIRGWRLSVEFGSDGRHIRLAMSSNTDDIGVLLDVSEAEQLSQGLSDLCRTETEEPRNWDY
jgi:hypothetical protein